MNKLILTLTCMILLTTSALADDLGCFEPNETVYATIQFNGVSGESAATSVSARVFDPDDTTTPTATPAMSAVDGTNALGLYRGSFSVGTPLAGTWTIRYKGTVDSVVKAGTDTFYVVDTTGDCASRTGVVTKPDAIDTEKAAVASTQYKVYDTSNNIATNTRKFNGRCLEATVAGNTQRSMITGFGTDGSGNFVNVKGFSAAPTDGSALNVYSSGCQ